MVKIFKFMFFLLIIGLLGLTGFWYVTTPQPLRADKQLQYLRDEAIFRVVRFKHGSTIEQNEAELRRLAAHGNLTAQIHLAKSAFARAETDPNAYQEAKEMLQDPVEAGIPLAQNAYGVMARDGLGGVPSDRSEAYKWFVLAAGQGLKQGRDNALHLAHAMTEAELAEARKRSDAWLADYNDKPLALLLK